MKRVRLALASLLAAAAIGFAAPASAAVSIPYPYTVCSITTTAATTCTVPGASASTPQQASVIIGFVNNSTTAQTATVTCYDNSISASGAVAASIGPLGVSQVITWPPPGRPLFFGLTCQASATPVGAGIEVYIR